MTKIKKIITSALVAAGIGTMGMTAFASTAHYFDFNIGMHNATDKSTAYPKDNTYSFAVVLINDVNISGPNNITFYVKNNTNKKIVTNKYYATGYESFYLDYESGEGIAENYYYLEGTTGYYSATAGGLWQA